MPELEESLRNILRDEVRRVVREELVILENRDTEVPRLRADAMMNVKEAARYLGISTSTLYRKAERVEVASVKIGSRVTFRVGDLDAFIAKRRRSPELVEAL